MRGVYGSIESSGAFGPVSWSVEGNRFAVWLFVARLIGRLGGHWWDYRIGDIIQWSGSIDGMYAELLDIDVDFGNLCDRFRRRGVAQGLGWWGSSDDSPIAYLPEIMRELLA